MHTVTKIFSFNPAIQLGGTIHNFMFILTYKITEDHLTLPVGGLHTFSSNMVVTFFELYYVLL